MRSLSWVRAALRSVTKPRIAAGACVAALALASLPAAAAHAVNTDHGERIVSANPADFTPHVNNGAVKSIVQVGTRIVAVGTFTSVSQTVGGAAITRNRIFAFDGETGTIDAGFDPNLDGAAFSVDTDGTFIYVGGSFNRVGGRTARKVAKLTADGQLVTNAAGASLLNRAPNGAVNEVVVRGRRLYIGGSFTNVGGAATPRLRLAALDTATGAVLPEVNVAFEGVYDPAIGGATSIKRMDVSTDGGKLVAVGNFSVVGGRPRSQLVVVDLPPAGAATVSPWATDRLDAAHNSCAGVFDTFARDVDIAPDGTWFAVTTTGAFAGGAYSGTLCDTTTRWQFEPATAGQQPVWTDYTGGDTTYGVAVTGSAVYVGGHMRWENNPFSGDNPGPGAVPREGIAALDPANGLPLSWNPGRTRGVGAEALYATAQGLWVGSDTARIGRETHKRIAFLPLAGGNVVPPSPDATLPNSLFGAGRAPTASTGVLYRVNAAGPALLARDNGPDWTADTGEFHGHVGNYANWGTSTGVDATVPASTPPSVFATELWDDGNNPEMTWSFPVESGKSVEVRLYFANRCSCTQSPGQRVFDVSIEGVVRLDDFDIVAAVGHNVGTMRAFTVTSDGSVDIRFTHEVENPLINAIEIVDPAAEAGTAAGVLERRPVGADGAPSGPASTANTAIDWSLLRGAFLLSGTLYYGMGDGRVYARSFNATTGAVGAARALNMYDDPDTGERIPFAVENMTGMFFEPQTHRIYYTLFNDSRLFYRYFTPESQIIGAETFIADTSGIDFSTASGMTLASGRVLYGSSADGALRSAPFSAGQVSGGATVTSNDGSWRYRALFVPTG